MSNTIECNFGTTCGDDGNLARPFLKKISFIRPAGLKTLGLVQVEFAQIPEAIKRARDEMQAKGWHPPYFTIDSISEYGAVLTDTGGSDRNSSAEHFFFVPIHNIACIHATNAT